METERPLQPETAAERALRRRRTVAALTVIDYLVCPWEDCPQPVVVSAAAATMALRVGARGAALVSGHAVCAECRTELVLVPADPEDRYGEPVGAVDV